MAPLPPPSPKWIPPGVVHSIMSQPYVTTTLTAVPSNGFRPRTVSFAVVDVRPPTELVVSREERIVEGSVIHFPQMSFSRPGVVEKVEHQSGFSVLRLSSRWFYQYINPSVGMRGEIKLSPEEMVKQFVGWLGEQITEAILQRVKITPALEPQLNQLAGNLLRDAQQQYPELQDIWEIRLTTLAQFSDTLRINVEAIVGQPGAPKGAGPRERVSTVQSISGQALAAGWAPLAPPTLAQIFEQMDGVEKFGEEPASPPSPEPKPSPFVDHKPYWKLPP